MEKYINQIQLRQQIMEQFKKLKIFFNDNNQQLKDHILHFYHMSTRAKYQRVNAKNINEEPKSQSDIILRRSERYGKYIGRALTLFFDEKKPFVVFKAAESIIQRAIWAAEVIKRKVAGLHQITRFTENKIVDVYKPKEQGLLEVRLERFLTVIEITLTKEPTSAQKADPGYQAPIAVNEKELLTQQKWLAEKGERQERRKRYEQGGERKERREGGQRRRQNEEGGERRRPNKQGYERKERREPRQDRVEKREGGQRRRGRNY